MSLNVEKLAYLASKEFKVHMWDAGTNEERYAQNNFFGRLASAVADKVVAPTAAKLLDWEIDLGDKKKTSLRTFLRWAAHDFADVKARIDALSKQVAQSGGGVSLSKEEQAAIYQKAVEASLGTYEVRRVETPSKETPK